MENQTIAAKHNSLFFFKVFLVSGLQKVAGYFSIGCFMLAILILPKPSYLHLDLHVLSDAIVSSYYYTELVPIGCGHRK